MTDDVPTSDGTRHTEEAVNIPQVTDPRTSSLEDIAQVLSAKTPDIADDPHPEKADSNGAGPAEGSAAEASSADADTDDADTETDTESDAESDAGDGPEPSAEEKAESEAESDQDDAPVEEAEAEAPQEGDAVVRSGDSKDELSEGESVTDEDAQPEADGAESDSDTDPESEAAEGASESVDDAGEGESAAESEESSSADEAEVVEEAAEPEAEVAESDEDEEDGASAEDSEVTESDVEAGETEEAESVEAEADESQVGEGESAAESEESSSADESEAVEEAADRLCKADEHHVADIVSIGVVNLLEMVDVEHDEGERFLDLKGDPHKVTRRSGKFIAVECTGERIDLHLPRHRTDLVFEADGELREIALVLRTLQDQLDNKEADRVDAKRNKIGMPLEDAILERKSVDHGERRERSERDEQWAAARIPAFVTFIEPIPHHESADEQRRIVEEAHHIQTALPGELQHDGEDNNADKYQRCLQNLLLVRIIDDPIDK